MIYLFISHIYLLPKNFFLSKVFGHLDCHILYFLLRGLSKEENCYSMLSFLSYWTWWQLVNIFHIPCIKINKKVIQAVWNSMFIQVLHSLIRTAIKLDCTEILFLVNSSLHIFITIPSGLLLEVCCYLHICCINLPMIC